ncbi:MAG: hypothetical protein FWE19_00485 [Oscillospiraceae bacterium]|nr:hypothetical protein [Oscillospiraceae bacterium]
MNTHEEIVRIAGQAAATTAAKEAAKVAIEMWEERRKRETAQRADRRLRNTRLLLDNYRSFVAHVNYAVYEVVPTKESAIYILDLMEVYDDMDSMVIESIKRTTARTAVIVSHIDEMLKIYRVMCETSKKPEDIRRFRIIRALYIEDEEMSIQALSEQESVDIRTVYRDRDIALERLAALFFGIDGMNRRR